MKKTLLTSAIIAFVSMASFAQQRLVILEHFTQASCGPCASQNPALKAVLDANVGKIVAIKYQTSWPGVDPMNAANPTDVQKRVTYYTVSGVPNSVMDGNFYKGAPSGVTAAKINQRYAVASTLNTTVNYTLIGNQPPLKDSMLISVKVKATSNIAAGMKLMVAAIEKEINFATAPGSNGEKKFESVMKKMFPTADGTNLPAMAAGDSLQYTFKWSLVKANGTPEYYDISNAAAVAFVQNNTTKEILNGGYDAPRPFLALERSINSKPTKVKAGNDVGFDFVVKSKTGTAQTVKITAEGVGLPSGWVSEVFENNVSLGVSPEIALSGNASKTLTLKISGPNGSLTNQKIKYKINAASINGTFPSINFSTSFTAIMPSSTLLMDVGGTALSRFTSSFAAASLPFLALDAEESASLDSSGLNSNSIGKIYYSTGAAYGSTMNNDIVFAFTNYLNSGGKLFMIGQDIGYEISTGGTFEAEDFYSTILGASYLADGSATAVTVTPVSTDPIYGSFLTGSLAVSGTGSYPDEIELSGSAPNAAVFLNYSTGNAAGIYNFDGNWKTVYVAFRMEAFSTANTGNGAFRNLLISTCNKWFDGTLTAVEFQNELRALSPAFPNPAKDKLMIPVLEERGNVTLTSISGQVVRDEKVSANNGGYHTLSTSGLRSGIYFLQLNVDGAKSPIQKIVIE